MVAFKSIDEVALAMIDFLRLVQPELDTKPGTVARDVFIDAPSVEISKLYSELRNIANLQSFSSASGTDLDRLARNFGLRRNTGSPASGTVFFTTNDLSSNIVIPSGTMVTSRSGITFTTLADIAMDTLKSNVYRANASRVKSELEIAGITDQFAIEVAVEASQNGEVGNVGKFSLVQHNVSGISNVTNLNSLSGGTSSERDSSFKARVLSVFSGSSVGTISGYVNRLLADSRVSNVLAVTPGDPLMTRDGTIVGKNSAGESVVISSGTGGKVDLYVQGNNIESFTESFIYRDRSGRGDATDPKNDFVLGQRGVNPFLDFQQKRKLLVGNGTLPFQPIRSVTSVSGSASGPNFIESFVDESGKSKGSFKLIKDESAFGGSAFGFDRIRFTSNSITLDDEASSKGTFNGQDPLDFTDIIGISSVTQDISIANESPTSDPIDRSLITLNHTPVSSVTRVDNLSTGERYTISNRFLDSNGLNQTGVVKISGSTLPSSTDILQANYIWNKEFDSNIDYDNLSSTTFARAAQNSVDWGFANSVYDEEGTVLYSDADGYHIYARHNISRIVDVKNRAEEEVVNLSGKLIVSEIINNVVSVKDVNGAEVFYTSALNGSFSGREITLPTDTLLLNSGVATVTYNAADLYSPEGLDVGSFSNFKIRLPEGAATAGETVYSTYIGNVFNLLPTTSLSSLPAVGDADNFIVNGDVVGEQPTSSVYVDGNYSKTLRFAPSHLKMNIQGISSTGRITVKGHSFNKVEGLVTIQRGGLTVDLTNAIKNYLGKTTVPQSVYVAMISSLENVDLSDGLVSGVKYKYDLLNHKLLNTRYSNNSALADLTIDKVSVKMSPTQNNIDNAPKVGDKLRVSFYIVNTNEVENITATVAGTRITKRVYVYVDKLTLNSGFLNSSGVVDGTISIDSFTQPSEGSAYSVEYSYTAPKEGERIIVSYNYNRLIGDSTFTIERSRPVTADVLVKESGTITIDVEMNIIPITSRGTNSTQVQRSVQEAISAYISSTGLDSIIDASDLISVAATVPGVDAVELIRYNTSGDLGKRKSISSGKNKYFVSGQISVTVVER